MSVSVVFCNSLELTASSSHTTPLGEVLSATMGSVGEHPYPLRQITVRTWPDMFESWKARLCSNESKRSLT